MSSADQERPRDQVHVVHEEGIPEVAVVTLDRLPVNAIDAPAKDQLIQIARELAEQPGLGAVVLGGRPTFSAGDDIREMQHLGEHAIELQVNGVRYGRDTFELVDPSSSAHE